MALISTLIADDDAILLDWIANIIDWEKEGFQIIGTASNGMQAFNLYQKYQPQLIITDVVMPVCDGIELLKNIRTNDQLSYIMMLSSYNDFSYAQESINLHANSYILKDQMNPDAMRAKLEEVKSYLSSTPQSHHKMEEQTIADYFRQTDSLSADSKVLDSKILGGKYGYICIESGIPLFSTHVSENQTDWIMSLLAEDFLAKNRHILAVPITNRHVLLLIKNTQNISLQSEYYFYQVSCDVLRILKQGSSHPFSLLYFNQRSNITDFKNNYFEHIILKYYLSRIDAYHKEIIPVSDIAFSSEEEEKVFDKEISDIISALSEKNFETAAELIKQCFALSLSNSLPRPEDMLIEIFRLLEYHYYINFKKSFLYQPIYTYKECEKTFLDICQALIEKQKQPSTSYSVSVQQVIEKIQHDFATPDLTVETLANSVFISPNYLSTIFKSETGSSVSEYITNTRIENAKTLLKNPEFKIYQIAMLSGYTSSQYFSQVFQKQTGLTPKEYRKKKLR